MMSAALVFHLFIIFKTKKGNFEVIMSDNKVGKVVRENRPISEIISKL
jgi:hypothetical protein